MGRLPLFLCALFKHEPGWQAMLRISACQKRRLCTPAGIPSLSVKE